VVVILRLYSFEQCLNLVFGTSIKRVILVVFLEFLSHLRVHHTSCMTDKNQLNAAAEEMAAVMATAMVMATAPMTMTARTMARMARTTALMAATAIAVAAAFLPAAAMVMLVAVLGSWLLSAYKP
jgi:hypothetical protein